MNCFATRAALLAGVVMFVLPSAAAAQDAVQTKTDDSAPIVVVGALTDTALDRKDIQLIQANDLSDLFRNEPSVTVGGSLGIAQKIYVRGLEDSMLNVTIDGAPQRGTLFHHVGRVSIEPELLESVDVQAGAGEATSGFGAIGGAIRFRTVDPTDLLIDGRQIGAIARGSWFSNDGYKLSGTVYGRLTGDIGLLGSFVHVDRNDFQDGNGTTLRGTSAKQQLGFVKIGGELGDGHRLTISYEQRNEEGAFGQRPNWPVLEGARLFPVEGVRKTAIANYGYEAAPGTGVEATGYWTRSEMTQDRYDRWGLYGADIESWGFDLRGRLRLANHDITAGVEHRLDRVVSQYLAAPAVWQDWAWSPDVGLFREEGSLIGLYLQDHWRVIDPLLISFGLRYDSYDLDQITYDNGAKSDGVSFNGGATFEVLPGLSLNAGYAEAFRGQEIGDAFTLEQRPGTPSLAPGLQPEQAENIEGGVKYDRDGITASAVYYRTKIRDVVLDQLGGATLYENVGSFKAEGVELRAGYRTGPFSVEGYFNHYDSRLNGNRIEGYEHIALGNSVGDNWAISAFYDPSPALGLRATLTRQESLDDIEVLFREKELGYVTDTQFIDKPGYTVVDLFGRWQPFASDLIELQLAVYNLFDVQYRAHASVGDYSAIPDYEIVAGLPEPGRNVRIGVSFRY
ncbi:TonB-dependent receptor [Altererythrobacter xixiisoli]|uniref:TonB-dependent receptor n=1 Tax=Croceibacterium xixiisoli TaxID=1476466 RepID=A0A6I4TW98_9SPHN|nr:TonB-dependent receptor [Croceibacterium xixiisoli]MXO99067.1 TonB-dependent receptor [Croceibacterium xixiisoli]